MVKILYVEDEVFLAKIVKEGLERNSFDVKHLSNGMQIEREIQYYLPDLCILDIMLPGKSGYEIAQNIRSIDQNLPIIFLTAKSQTTDLVKGFQTGGNDYIKKPFSMEELLVRIDNLLQINQLKLKQESAEEIILGINSKFYPQKQQLICHGTTLQLSYKECQIVELLCKNINRSTERKAILLHVWGDDSYFNSRNLDVYIRKLRKIMAIDDKLRILTLKGVGYHFVVDS